MRERVVLMCTKQDTGTRGNASERGCVGGGWGLVEDMDAFNSKEC